MTVRRLRLVSLAGACLLLHGAAGFEGRMQHRPGSTPAADTGSAPIGDVQLHYEIRGAGEPILFMHGGGGSVATSWPAEYAADLSRDFMVIMADSRGHGRSTEGAGPITAGRLAFDAVRLLDHLGLARAHIVGHSVGAIVGLHLLVDFPDRIDTATLLAGLYHVDNYRPAAFADLKRELAAVQRGEMPGSRLASRPPSVLKKLQSAWLAGPAFTLRHLETITRPTLIVSAGQDVFFAPAVAEEMHAHISGSELLHFPDASHRVQVDSRGELVPALREFITRRRNQ